MNKGDFVRLMYNDALGKIEEVEEYTCEVNWITEGSDSPKVCAKEDLIVEDPEWVEKTAASIKGIDEAAEGEDYTASMSIRVNSDDLDEVENQLDRILNKLETVKEMLDSLK